MFNGQPLDKAAASKASCNTDSAIGWISGVPEVGQGASEPGGGGVTQISSRANVHPGRRGKGQQFSPRPFRGIDFSSSGTTAVDVGA